MRATRLLVAATAAMVLLGGCGSGYGGSGKASSAGPIKIMFGSSGDAETAAVQAAARSWATSSGKKVQVIPAQNLDQQLGQGFAGGTPPDVFYLDPTKLQQYAQGGSLYAYGDQLPKSTVDDFYPALRQSYTYQGKLYCAPKDLSTHALVINTDLWKAAGLTAADYPKTWDQLTAVATRLTSAQHVGLTYTGDHNTAGTFMLAAGGWFLNGDDTKVTADSPANLKALQYLQANQKKKVFAAAKTIGAQWGGEAFGKGKAAMDVEGDWIIGSLKSDYPNVHWTAVPMPAGPSGTKGTTVFSNCWGIAAKSGHRADAVKLVESLVSADSQKKFQEAFGATPSRQSLKSWSVQQNPNKASFEASVAWARGPVPVPGFTSVLADFDTGLENLAAGSATPQQLLQQLQANGTRALRK
jgi:multiple sugar transport system substrate-binding protein